MKQNQKQPLFTLYREHYQGSNRDKLSKKEKKYKKKLERIAKEGRKGEMNFRNVLCLNTPHKHLLKFKEMNHHSQRSSK